MTNTVESHPKWDRNEFLAFLLLYAANVDADYSSEEQAFIQNNIDQKALKVVEGEFNAMSDYEHILVIRKYEGAYYPSEQHKEQILDQVRGLFQADGEMSIEESSLLMMLKKLL